MAVNIPECITSGGVPIGSSSSGGLGRGGGVFSDCFHLSWTTFS